MAVTLGENFLFFYGSEVLSEKKKNQHTAKTNLILFESIGIVD